MDRRAFLGTLGLLAPPLAATAQEAKVYRIGYLSSANPRSAAFFQAFEQRLRELGYIEGRNLAIEFRNAEGRLDRLAGLAAELKFRVFQLIRLAMQRPYQQRDTYTRAVSHCETGALTLQNN